jgi:hypothetical protein
MGKAVHSGAPIAAASLCESSGLIRNDCCFDADQFEGSRYDHALARAARPCAFAGASAEIRSTIQINYVNRASLVIESADARLLTNPWFAGPAYARQRHPFQKPVDVSIFDHRCDRDIACAHEASLKQLGKSKPVFNLFNWYKGAVE